MTQEDVDAALQAVLDSQKAAIDDIYARLEKGEAALTDFDFRVMRNCMRVSIREALRGGD